MSAAIADLRARQVWDSRGRPTIEVEVALASGARGRCIAPAGASTGRREALDRRDGGTRLRGRGVDGPLGDLNGMVRDRLLGLDALDQAGVDRALIALDGTPGKTRLGGNATVAASGAVAWAAAAQQGLPLWRHLRAVAGLADAPVVLPLPMIQIFGGGRHAGGRVDIQDFLVTCPGAQTFSQTLEWTAEVYYAAADIMGRRGRLAGVADEGGLWPDFENNEQALATLLEAIEAAGYSPRAEVAIALDVAASSFATADGYALALEGRTLSTAEMIALCRRWCETYPIVSIEDPVGEDDDAGFATITRELGGRVLVVGDDYLTSNAAAIEAAAAAGACNAVLLKSNQCGTITELIAASNAARRHGWATIQSARSGESEDVTLAHLAMGLGSDQIKVGSITRSERTAKWNEMLRIEETLPGAPLWKAGA